MMRIFRIILLFVVVPYALFLEHCLAFFEPVAYDAVKAEAVSFLEENEEELTALFDKALAEGDEEGFCRGRKYIRLEEDCIKLALGGSRPLFLNRYWSLVYCPADDWLSELNGLVIEEPFWENGTTTVKQRIKEKWYFWFIDTGSFTDLSCLKALPKGSPVFETEGIAEVKVCWYRVQDGMPIPAERLADMVAYLRELRIGEPMPRPIPPGTNTFTLEILYEDGHTLSHGTDTHTVSGIIYRIEGPGFPDWLLELITAADRE